ncbi:permease-like cell division protein FtsX [Paenibacillus marinisediminis]
MTLNTLLRHIREGSKSVFRNGWMSVASVSSIVISLFVLGVFIILTLNINSLTKEMDSQVQIQVYLHQEVTQEQIDLLKTDIGSMAEVSKVEFLSKADGMKQMEKSLGEDGEDFLSGYTDDTNPLPDSLIVEVHKPETIPMVAKKIESINETNSAKPIWQVKYGGGPVEKMLQVTEAVRNFGFILVIGLAVTSMFLISNTIKVTIMARQREISIMKMVGATNAFIRWPFFIEGVLLGLIGSIVTLGILMFGYSQLITAANDAGWSFLQLIPLREVWLIITGSLLVLGVLIGVWGSVTSTRKYLKV